MAVPLHQTIRVGAYVVKQHLIGRQALSAGADAGAAVPLQSRLRRLRQDRLSRPDPQPAPLGRRVPRGGRRVRRAGGRRSPAASRCCTARSSEIVEGIIARKKFVYLCTNALLLEKKIDLFKPSPYFAWSVHLDGDQEEHDRSVCQDGVYDRAVAAIRLAKQARLPRQHQLHAVRQRRARARRRVLRRRDGDGHRRHHRLARLCL